MQQRSAPEGRQSLSQHRAVDEGSQDWPTCCEEYSLLEQVGKGATAEVWIGYCRSLDSLAAVKKYYLTRDPLCPDEDPAVQEVAIMRRLKHANVLPVLSAWMQEEHMWLVTPYCKGGSVADILKARHPRGLPEPAIATIAAAVLNGLAYVHREGFMHRDVKAANILVGEDGQVRLADFGVACALSDDVDTPTLHELHIKPHAAARSTPIGTPVFMAPEVINASDGDGSEPYDERADTWAFGIFLLEMCYGCAPNANSSLESAAIQTLHQPPPQLEDTNDRVFSRELKDLVKLCLDKDRWRPAAADLLQHSFIVKHSTTNQGLSEILFRIPEPEMDATHSRHRSSEHAESLDSASVTAALTEDAEHATSMLKRSVSTKLETKLPRPKSTSWIPDLHLADLHLPIVQSEQHLRREEIAGCKAIMIGTSSRRGRLLTSSGHGRGFVVAKGSCESSDGTTVTFWSAPYFLTLVGHGLGLSVGRERLSWLMLLPSAESLLGTGQIHIHSRPSLSRSSFGHRTSIRNVVSARGCSIRSIMHVNGHQVDLTAVALQIEGDVQRNTAVYGDADVSAILGGSVRPPKPFKGLIEALVALEE